MGTLGVVQEHRLLRACTIVCVNTQNKVEIPGGKHDYRAFPKTNRVLEQPLAAFSGYGRKALALYIKFL
jgi:hypothetical protein